MKRIIAMLVSVILLITPFGIISTFAANETDTYIGTELITDGGFDNPIGTNWTIVWGPNSTIEQADAEFAEEMGKTGDNCLTIPNWSGGVQQQNIALKGGYRYSLSFLYAPCSKAGEDVGIRVIMGEFLDKQVASSESKYVKMNYTFNVEEDTTVSLWLLRDSNASANPPFIDDVSLTPVKSLNDNSEDEHIGLENVKDGGFDNPIGTNWTIVWGPNSTIEKADAKFADEMGKTGDNCLTIPNWSGGVQQQNIALKGGYRYSLSFLYAPCSKAGEDVGIRVIVGEFLDKQVASSESKYVKMNYTFKVEEDTTVSLWFLRDSNASANPPFIDDVSIVAKNSLEDEPNITLNSTQGAKVQLDKTRAKKGETVTLKISDIMDGFTLAQGFPTYTINGTATPLSKVSDTEYNFIMPAGETTVEIRFSAAIGTELLPDVGFESGEIPENADTGWKSEDGQAYVVSEDPYEGKYCLNVNKNATRSLETDVFIEEGSTYLLSFVHFGANEGTQHNTGVFLMDGENNYIDPLLTTNDDDWNRYAAVFTADKTGNMTVIVKNVSSQQKAYFDNISLKKVDPANPDPDAWSGNYNPSKDIVPDTTNILKDSSFESRKFQEDMSKGWAPYNTASENMISFSKYDWLVHSGENAMRVAASTEAGATQKVKVKPNTNYEITFWCVSDTDGAGILVGSSLENKSDIYSFKRVKKADGFVKYNVAFKTPNVKEIYVSLSNPSEYVVYFDDVTLNELDNRIKGDLGFRKTAEIKTSSVTDTGFTLEWSAVKSKLNHNKDLTYYIYCSKNEITAKNISALEPKGQVNGASQRLYTVTGLDDFATYNIAVMAVDSLGNKAYLFGESVKTNPSPSTKIENGGFETGDLKYWYTLSPDKVVMSQTTADGKWSAMMLDWCYLFYQPIVTEPNTDYVLSYDAFQASGAVKVFVFEDGTSWFDDSLYTNQLNESTEFQKYTGTLTTGPNSKKMMFAFYNGEDYHYTTVDNVYFKKIENKDLYFFNEPQNFLATKDAIIVNWLQVHSADKPENITYEVFMSKSAITKENIDSLKPFAVNKGADSTMALAEGLERGKGYYFAVRAKDSLGNVVEEFTSAPLYTLETEAAVEDDEEDEKDEEIIDTEEENTDVSDNYIGNTDDDLDINEDMEIIDVQDTTIKEEPAKIKKTSTKFLTSTTVTPLWGKRITGIALIILGCAIVAVPVLLAFKKKRR